MAAAIVLDQAVNVSYTNLDQISGKVVVRCGKPMDVDAIDVKVEGESRTRLLSPPGPNGERPKPQLEYHKVYLSFFSRFDNSNTNVRRSCTRLSLSRRNYYREGNRKVKGTKLPTHFRPGITSILSL
jgi:hypothetical protein